jgi:hypothetical protein
MAGGVWLSHGREDLRNYRRNFQSQIRDVDRHFDLQDRSGQLRRRYKTHNTVKLSGYGSSSVMRISASDTRHSAREILRKHMGRQHR